jgi:hypothetical protein
MPTVLLTTNVKVIALGLSSYPNRSQSPLIQVADAKAFALEFSKVRTQSFTLLLIII